MSAPKLYTEGEVAARERDSFEDGMERMWTELSRRGNYLVALSKDEIRAIARDAFKVPA